MAIKGCMMQTCSSSSVSYIYISKMRNKSIYKTRSWLISGLRIITYMYTCNACPNAHYYTKRWAFKEMVTKAHGDLSSILLSMESNWKHKELCGNLCSNNSNLSIFLDVVWGKWNNTTIIVLKVSSICSIHSSGDHLSNKLIFFFSLTLPPPKQPHWREGKELNSKDLSCKFWNSTQEFQRFESLTNNVTWQHKN